jgi:hypothetical protein
MVHYSSSIIDDPMYDPDGEYKKTREVDRLFLL